MRNLIYILSLALIFIACEDQLLRTPKDVISPSEFETENDIIYALNGTYKALTGMGLEGIDKQNVEPVITDFITDNGFMDKSWMGVVEYWDQGHNQFSQFAERKWTRNYVGILRANTILAYMHKVEMADDLRKQYDAQARFLRAYFYSDLIHYYGDVPLRLKPDGLESKDIARTSKDSIITFIYQEMDSVIQVLPTKEETEHGRATKAAAQALKAWVALNNYDYDECIDACDGIIDDALYSLHYDYAGLFKPETEINNEVIFSIQYMMDKTVEVLSEPYTTYFYSWSSFMADYSLVSSYYTTEGLKANETNPAFDPQDPFIDRDPRLGMTFALPYKFNGFTNNGDTLFYIPYNKKAYNFSSLRINKYVDYNVEHIMRGKKSTGTNIVLSRYADVLLMKAEAMCMRDGAAADAAVRALVDQVRQRPGVMMPKVEDVEGTGLSQEQLLDVVKHERRVEFAFEGTRILDIKRWDIGAQAYVDGRGYDPNYLYYWVVNDDNLAQMEEDDIVPSNMMRYLKRDSYFLDKIFKTEQAFRDQMAKIFTPDNGFDNNELENYDDIIIDYVEPKFKIYTFRNRTFNANKGYLWPIPYSEIQSNDLINANNPGY